MLCNCVGNFGNWLGEIGPRFLASFTFIQCGLLIGYTVVSFTADSNNLNDFLYYGPLVLGCLAALITSISFVVTKFWRNKILFYHFELFIATSSLNIIASILFFIKDAEIYGSYIAFISYGITFITALTYLNIISSKNNRTIILSICFAWYLFGLATSVSLIGINFKNNNNNTSNHTGNTNINTTNINNYNIVNNISQILINDTNYDFDNTTISYNTIESDSKLEKYKINNINENIFNKKDAVYQGMAGIYLTSTLIIILILVIIKIYHYLGNLDYKKSLEYDIHIANSNETIFDSRDEVLKQMNFFYVTKSKQWLVSFILVICDSIHFSLFMYIISWFIYNPAISLTKDYDNFSLVYWIIFFGSIFGILLLIFFSIKILFVTSTLLQIILLFLGMIIRNTTLIPLWIVCFLYGINFSNIKIQILETSHLKYSELMIFIFCFTKLCSIGVINVSFIRDPINSIFYREDAGTLIAHCLAYVTISALITIIVTIKVPRTHKNSLFDIQNALLGIVYQKHQIEQLNMKYLNDGTIPTISKTVETENGST